MDKKKPRRRWLVVRRTLHSFLVDVWDGGDFLRVRRYYAVTNASMSRVRGLCNKGSVDWSYFEKPITDYALNLLCANSERRKRGVWQTSLLDYLSTSSEDER